MTLKNKLGEWMHGNKTWTIPQKDGEGYIEELENNSSVLGLMDRYIRCEYIFTVANKQPQLNNQ